MHYFSVVMEKEPKMECEGMSPVLNILHKSKLDFFHFCTKQKYACSA